LVVGESEMIDFEVAELCESFDVVYHEFFQVSGGLSLEHPNLWTDDKILVFSLVGDWLLKIISKIYYTRE
jgi:hypothetical protein